jgi:hypothetical protein
VTSRNSLEDTTARSDRQEVEHSIPLMSQSRLPPSRCCNQITARGLQACRCRSGPTPSPSRCNQIGEGPRGKLQAKMAWPWLE